eukprot:950642_1
MHNKLTMKAYGITFCSTCKTAQTTMDGDIDTDSVPSGPSTRDIIGKLDLHFWEQPAKPYKSPKAWRGSLTGLKMEKIVRKRRGTFRKNKAVTKENTHDNVPSSSSTTKHMKAEPKPKKISKVGALAGKLNINPSLNVCLSEIKQALNVCLSESFVFDENMIVNESILCSYLRDIAGIDLSLIGDSKWDSDMLIDTIK